MNIAGNTAIRAVGALALALSICVSCDHSTAPAPAVPAQIVLSGSAAVAMHAHQALAPTVLDAGGKDITTSAHIVWTSNNPAVATVSDSGVVYGVALGGPATITGTIGSLSATATVTVIPANIAITPALRGMQLNAAQQLTGQALDFLGTPIDAGPVAWSSSAPDIATVDAASGVLSGVALGNAVISASAGGKTSQLGIFVGAVSDYDGVYTSLGNNDPVQVRVSLGRITDFSAVVHIYGCVMTIASQPYAVVADVAGGSSGTITHVASFTTEDGSATVRAQFQAGGIINGSFGGSILTNAHSCATATNQGSVLSIEFQAARQ